MRPLQDRQLAWPALLLAAAAVVTAAPALAGKAFNCQMAAAPEPGIVLRVDGGAPRATYRVDGVGEAAAFLRVPVDLTTDGSGSGTARVEALCQARGAGRVRLTLGARGEEPLTCELCLACDGIGTLPTEVACFAAGSPGGPGAGDCVELREVSEEEPPAQCPPGYLVKGMGCRGRYCDDKRLTCCRYRAGESEAPECRPGPYDVSEEPPHDRFRSDSGFLCGVGCSGRYCDAVRPWIADDPILVNSGRCYETPFISEEPPDLYRRCRGEDWWVAGLRCKGRYCDALALVCCAAQGATVVDH